MSEIKFDETVLTAMVEFEGFPFEEAKLAYAQREKLPDTAFCGPHRTYPAHDATHVRNGLSRLGTFGHRLKPNVRSRILGCLKNRAKQYGIEVSETIEGMIALCKYDETIPEETRKKMQTKIDAAVKRFEKKNKK